MNNNQISDSVQDLRDWMDDVVFAQKKVDEILKGMNPAFPDPCKLRDAAEWAEELVASQRRLADLCVKHLPAILDAAKHAVQTPMEAKHALDQMLAAFDRDDLSEGDLAEFLGTDRVTARGVAAAWRRARDTAPTFLERHAATLEAQRMRDADAKIYSLLREVDTLRGWVRVVIDGGMFAPARDTPERCAAVDGLAAFAGRE